MTTTIQKLRQEISIALAEWNATDDAASKGDFTAYDPAHQCWLDACAALRTHRLASRISTNKHRRNRK